MKLWIKISLLCGAVLLASMGAFCGVLVYETWQYSLNKTIESSAEKLQSTADGVAMQINSSSLSQYSKTTSRAYLNYVMKRYRNEEYLLLADDEVIFNRTDYELLDGNEDRWQDTELEYVIQRTDGEHILVMGQRLDVRREESYRLVLVRNISDLYDDVGRQTLYFGLAAFLVLFFAVDIIFWLVRWQLKPLRQLERTATEISRGNYEKRMPVRTKDEVGHVGKIFNQMAEQVEEQMQELETVSEQRRQLLSALTHELRTPMTSIIGYSDTLMNVKLSEEQQKRALGHINAECHRLERLAGKMMSLLGMYDESKISKEPYAMRDLFLRVSKLEAYRFQEHGMKLLMDCRMGVMQMDVDLMESLLVNLLDNAVKASAKGSVIEMKSWDGGILVRDHGKGIPKEELPHVTEAFYMVDKSRSKKAGGIGLGLALCVRIAEIHGGRLQIESVLGEGTTVTVLFPKETENPGEERIG